jgi:hypothetical protein
MLTVADFIVDVFTLVLADELQKELCQGCPYRESGLLASKETVEGNEANV